jgi:hypothetical protein
MRSKKKVLEPWPVRLLAAAEGAGMNLEELKKFMIYELRISPAAVNAWFRVGKNSRQPRMWVQELLLERIKRGK